MEEADEDEDEDDQLEATLPDDWLNYQVNPLIQKGPGIFDHAVPSIAYCDYRGLIVMRLVKS
jgi:hypothetical protein